MNTKTVFRVLFVAAVVTLVSFCMAPVAADETGQSAYAPNHVIVRFQDGIDSAGILAASPAPVGVLMDFGNTVSGLQVLQLSEGFTVEDAIDYYSSLPGVLYAEPDYYCSLTSYPSDPGYSRLWGLKNLSAQGGVSAESAWDITTGNDSIVVAVLDTGVDIEHPDLEAHIWTNQAEYSGLPGVDDDGNGYKDDVHGWNFFVNSPNVTDYNSHGTHCSGIIGAVANNNYGIAGTAWNVTIMPVAVLPAAGSGELSCILAGIDYAVNNHADIISMSLGGSFSYDKTYHDMINSTEKKGIVVVASAGNNGADTDQTPHWPSSFPNANIIAVAASDQSNDPVSYSNYGNISVDLAAPGVEIYSTFPQVSMTPGKLDPVTANNTEFGQLGDIWTEEIRFNGTKFLGIYGMNSSVLYYAEPIVPKGEQFSLSWAAAYDNLTPFETLSYLISTRNFSEYTSVEDMLNHSSEWYVSGYNSQADYQYEESMTDLWSSIRQDYPTSSDTYYVGIYYNSTNADSHVSLYTTTIANDYRITGHVFEYEDGTSMATPMVSGAVALIKSVNPDLTPSEIRELLINTVDRFDAWKGKIVSGGRLNISAAVMAARPELDVLFNSTGGSAVQSQKVLYGETAVRPSPNPTKEGYAFEDWYADTTLSTKWDFDTDTIKVPTTIYANWTLNTSHAVADTNGTAVFGTDNITAVHSTAGNRISTILLEDVRNISAGTAVEFTADNMTVQSIPDISGRERIELSIFEINATVSSGTTARFNLTVVFSNATTAAKSMNDIRIWHYNTSEGAWDTQPLDSKLNRMNETVTYTVSTASFSPLGAGLYTVVSQPSPSYSGSSRQSGSTVILPEGTAVPTVMPTITPTQVNPTVKPTTQPTTQTTQNSSAPAVGLIAGLGAASLALIRKRR